MGKAPVESMASIGIVAKKRTVTSLRGGTYHLGGIPTLITYSPDVNEIDHGWYVDMLTDLSLAIRLHDTGSLEPKLGDYRWVESFDEIIAKVEAKYAETGRAIDCTFDMETLGLDPLLLPTAIHPGAYIVCVQMTMEEGKTDAFYFLSRQHEEEMLKGKIGEQINWWLNSEKIKLKGSNLKYDLIWIWTRAKIECSNFVFDTTLVGSSLDENRSNSLNVHTKIYAPQLGGYDDEFERTTDKARMDLVPKDKMLPYAGGDTDASLRVSNAQKPILLADPALTAFYVNILHPASRAFEHIERGGMLIDKEKYDQLGYDLMQEIESLIHAGKKLLGGRIVAKHADEDKLGGLNLTKASLIKDYMFSPMGLNLKPRMWTQGSIDKNPKDKSQWTPSTAREHIEMFEDVPEAQAFVKLFSAFSSATKTYNTYYTGFLVHLRSDGRFHANYFLYKGDDQDEDEGGTNTGRLSAKNPAVQTIPKHTKWAKRLRECFIAPPGYLVMERDFSQGELRVIACIANEENMIAAYKANRDLHSETAGPFRGYNYEQMMDLMILDKELFGSIRQLGKAGNFGLCFGMQAEGFQIYARVNYGVNLTLQEAMDFRDGFFSRYPNLLKYHELYKAFARQNLYVRGPLGRIRHLPLITSPIRALASKAERQSINAPVQGTLSDMLIWTLALEHKAGYTVKCPAFASIHDAAYNYVPEDHADEWVPKHMDIMQNLPFDKVNWKPQLNFPADAKIGPDMAHLKEVKVA